MASPRRIVELPEIHASSPRSRAERAGMSSLPSPRCRLSCRSGGVPAAEATVGVARLADRNSANFMVIAGQRALVTLRGGSLGALASAARQPAKHVRMPVVPKYARKIPVEVEHVSSHHRTLGKNLAIRFPAEVAKAAGLGDGQRVEVVPRIGEVVIRKVAPEETIEDLFRARSPEEWRALYRDAYVWGLARGRERVEE